MSSRSRNTIDDDNVRPNGLSRLPVVMGESDEKLILSVAVDAYDADSRRTDGGDGQWPDRLCQTEPGREPER